MHKETRALQALNNTKPTTLTGIVRLQLDTQRHWQNIQNEYNKAQQLTNELNQKIHQWKTQNRPTPKQWQNEIEELQRFDQQLLGHSHP